MYTGCTVVCSQVKKNYKEFLFGWKLYKINSFLQIKINPRNRTEGQIRVKRLVQENLNMDIMLQNAVTRMLKVKTGDDSYNTLIDRTIDQEYGMIKNKTLKTGW